MRPEEKKEIPSSGCQWTDETLLVVIVILRPQIRNGIAQKPTWDYKRISPERDMQMTHGRNIKNLCVQAETITDINTQDDKFIPL